MNSRTQKKDKIKRLEKPIIFIGTGRSGTSVISEIIMRHKDLAFPSHYQEIFFRIPCINLIRILFDNKLWRIHGEKNQLNKVKFFNKFIFRRTEAYKMWDYLTGPDLDFSRGFLLNKKASNERVKFIRNYFNKMVKYQKRKRLSFKIAGPSRMEYLLSIFPDAYFVIIKRNPIPTISSFLKVDFWKRRGFSKLWSIGAYSEKEIKLANDIKDNPELLTALQIKKLNEMTKLECQKCNPNYIEVNYEDFVIKSQEEIIRILNFLNLEKDDACLNYLKEKKIYSRNKPETEYFSEEQLVKINEILNMT